MNLLFLTSGTRAPSSRFRVLQYVPHLRKLGHRCTVWPSRPEKYESYRWLGWRLSERYRRWRRAWEIRQIPRRQFDVVLLERELFDDPSWEQEAQLRNVAPALVLDVDDGIHLRYPEKFAKVATFADRILAGNRLLQQVAARYNAQVTMLPTCVDCERYQPRPFTALSEPRRPIIGWTGTSSNLPYLQSLAEPLQQLYAETPFELQVITDFSPSVRRFDMGIPTKLIRWSEKTELRDLAQFEIGIMPLPDDEWSRHKCGFKLIQYLATGIPAVASPVGVNREIIQPGVNGELAETSEDWKAALQKLLQSSDLRLRYGQAGRQRIVERYSVQSQLPTLVSALQQAANHAESKRGE